MNVRRRAEATGGGQLVAGIAPLHLDTGERGRLQQVRLDKLETDMGIRRFQNTYCSGHGRGLACLLCPALVLFSFGCRQQVTVTVESEPPDAEVRLDGKTVGRTPTKVELRHDGQTITLTAAQANATKPAAVPSPRTTKKLSAGFIPLTANLPFFVALDQGYFQRHGVQVEAIEATSPNDIVTGLAAGELDFAGVLAYSIIFPASIRHPDQFVLFNSCEETLEHFTSSIIVKQNSPIASYRDLRGKRIGVYTGLVQINFLKAILIGLAIDPSEVEIIQISPRLQVQGLVSDQYDALSSTEPTTNIARLQGLARPVIENPRVRYILSPFPSAATVLSRRLVETEPDVAKAVVAAFNDAVDFINAHPENAKRALPKYTQIPKANKGEVLADLKLFKYCKLGEENRLNVQRFADFLFENGILRQRIENVNLLFGDYQAVPRD